MYSLSPLSVIMVIGSSDQKKSAAFCSTLSLEMANFVAYLALFAFPQYTTGSPICLCIARLSRRCLPETPFYLFHNLRVIKSPSRDNFKVGIVYGITICRSPHNDEIRAAFLNNRSAEPNRYIIGQLQPGCLVKAPS